TSTSADPTHTFTVPGGDPAVFTVTLTVRDDQNQPHASSIQANVNNTPPAVAITSFPDGQSYPVGADTTFALEASVSDAEHELSELTFAWQTVLHHNNHIHAEPFDHAMSSFTVISGVGCYGEDFHYVVHLTVTDPGGLSTTVSHQLVPDCARIAPTAVVLASTHAALPPVQVTFDGSQSVDNGTITSYTWDFGDGTSDMGPLVTKTFTEDGDHQITLMVTDDDGLSASATTVFRAYNMDPPQCAGAAGSVLREYWT